VNAWLAEWQVYVLALVRISALLMLVPVLGGRQVPARIRICVSLLLALFACRYWIGAPAGAPWEPLALGLLALKEALVGLALAFTLILVLTAFQVAGELLGFEMMFSAASVFSLSADDQTTVTGQFTYLLAVLIFLALDGLHALLGGLELSFRTLPVSGWPAGLGAPGAWVTLSGRVLEVGLRLALPLLAALFITNLALGMVARTLPQINIFVIGMPLQVAAGFLLLIMLVGQLFPVEEALLRHWAHDVKGLLYSLAR
jgi:flagellar biosynthesis protein FliR